MIYQDNHTTTYRYSEPVSQSHNILRLTTRNGPYQTSRHGRLFLSPTPATNTAGVDYFGNPTAFVTILEAHTEFQATAVNVAEVRSPNVPEVNATPAWEQVRDQLRSDRSSEVLEAFEFVFPSSYIPELPELAEYASPSFPKGRPILEAALDLTARIYDEFTYDPTATTVATPLRDVVGNKKGVCQDFAHLQIGCLRSLGLAARYVSGYLLTVPPPGQERLQGADASHAWLSIFVPGAGWIDLDPTNNIIPDTQHILLGWGRDYDDVGPIKGVILGGGQHTVEVGVDVEDITAAS